MQGNPTLDRGHPRLQDLLRNRDYRRVERAAEQRRALRNRAMLSARAHRNASRIGSSVDGYTVMLREAANTYVGIAREHNWRLVICLQAMHQVCP